METITSITKKWLHDPVIGGIVSLVVGAVVIFAFIRFLQRIVTGNIRDPSNRYRLRKLLTLLGYLALVIYGLALFGGSLSRLTVIFGVAGAGIAFSLQEVIASIAGWFAISAGSFFKIGDRVELGGITGDVIDIGVLRTTVMECGQWIKADLYNGRIVRIANSFVLKEPVFNYSGEFPFLWDEITVPIRYGSDYALARKLIRDSIHEAVGEFISLVEARWQVMVRSFMIEDAQLEPMVTLAANDNWVEFTGRYVVDYKKRRGTKDKIFTRILEQADATSGKVQFASATFELVAPPELKFRSTSFPQSQDQ